jgi:hypothetical protein
MKILLIDIETAPMTSYTWGTWKQNIGIDMIANDWYILSYCAKWLDKSTIYYKDSRLARTQADRENDKPILTEICQLLDEADVVIAHNAKKFDIKKINARLLINDIQPPSPYQIIDTLDVARSKFAITSNKLAYLCEVLKVENKKLTHAKFPGFKLWKECMSGNEEAWQEMEDYNKVDVLALEEVYLKLRPWMSNHPTVSITNAADDKHHCSHCNSTNLESKGYRYTKAGKYKRYVCKDCGSYSRERFTCLDEAVADKLLVSESR